MSIRNLIRRDTNPAGAPVSSLQNEMSRFFEDFWTGSWPAAFEGTAGMTFNPNVEVSQTDRAIEVSAELPGLSDKDIEVTLSRDHDAVILRGEKKFSEEKKDKNFFRAERRYGSFQRVVPLPAPVKADGIEATFKDGVLHLTMARANPEEHGVKRIPIARG